MLGLVLNKTKIFFPPDVGSSSAKMGCDSLHCGPWNYRDGNFSIRAGYDGLPALIWQTLTSKGKNLLTGNPVDPFPTNPASHPPTQAILKLQHLSPLCSCIFCCQFSLLAGFAIVIEASIYAIIHPHRLPRLLRGSGVTYENTFNGSYSAQKHIHQTALFWDFPSETQLDRE